MIEFRVVARSDLGPADTLSRLLDLEAHAATIPLTGVSHDGTGLRQGSRFTARTAIGGIGFDDVMRVEQWQQPSDRHAGRVLIRKVGSLLSGRIEILVRPTPDGSVVEWRQELGVKGFPRWLERPAAPVAAAAYRSVIRRLLG